MSENSKIEWTDHTFNPWIGCTKVSPGCDNCYAAVSTPARVKGIKWGVGEARRRTADSTWHQPKAWNARHYAFFAEHGRRQRVFCASLADVFDNEVDNNLRNELLGLIYDTPHLDWLLLTKRIGNVPRLMEECTDPCKQWELPPNVWLGATIVNQEEADRDIPKLLDTPAAVRFLSMEPLLGAVDISRFLDPVGVHCMDYCADSSYVCEKEVELAEGGDEPVPLCPHCGQVASWTGYDDGIDWVIVGGESGAGARPMHPDWARSLRDQCAAAGVPFLFKQWGEHVVLEDGAEACRVCGCTWNNACSGGCSWAEPGLCSSCVDCEPASGDRAVKFARVGKRAAGRELDGHTHDGFPEVSQ